MDPVVQEGDVVQLQPRFDESRRETITVPKGHVWVEGDNPTLSVDSRHIGAVPVALLLGRARVIVRSCYSGFVWSAPVGGAQANC